MSDIKLSQLPEVTSLAPTDIIPNVASGVTSKITVANLASTLGGATSALTKYWVENVTQSIQPNETIVVSDNYVMKNCVLILSGSAEYYDVGPLNFSKKAELIVGGHILFIDSQIINDGVISVAGGIILSGSSTITGTGTII